MTSLTGRRIRSRAARAVALLFLLLAMLGGGGGDVAAKMREDRLTLTTAAGAKEIAVEVAETPEEQALGLMFRTSLDDGHGMLFAHPEQRELHMWMHNTYIPLDMVFIRADGVVHRIEARAEPMSDRIIASEGDVKAVLELAGGAAERLGLKPGDRVTFGNVFR